MQVYKEGDRVVTVIGPTGGFMDVNICEATPRKRGRGLIWKIVQRLGRYGTFSGTLAKVTESGLPFEDEACHNKPVPTKESIVLDVLQNKG